MQIPNTMLAAVLMGPDKLELKEVKTPQPGSADILIKVEACAVCSSDVSLISKPWPGQPPYGSFIPGHEYSGIVVALGETVDEFKIGDRITVEAHLGCLRCRNCRIGNYTACLNYGNIKKGHRANGFTTNGGYAQFVINHINTVYKIPDSISFEEASLVTNLGCVLYGFETVGGYLVGDNVVVIGPGPLGLLSVQVAKVLGAHKVFLVGTRESRLKVGLETGADRAINIHEEDPIEIIKDETGGIGVDLVIESSGAKGGLDMSIKLTKRMGKLLLLGFPHELVEADIESLGLDNKSIYTVRGEGWANCYRAISLLEKGRIDLKPLITHSFPLKQIDEAFNTFIKRIGGAIKVTVKPNFI
ncbi:MAG: alcohol dehydrogenase [Candidatus Altiarchaeales archaeon WOR_SM1_79]|nr:MAG: alcohol dehydrogenase [Candidatus Altiarchaeales archaeon WOR_SM1_79]